MGWTEFVASTTAKAAEVNGNFDFLEGNIVPHSQGTIANNEFTLGSTTAIWKTVYASSINAQNITLSGTAAIAGNITVSGTASYIKQLGVNTTNAPSVSLDVNGRINAVTDFNGFVVNIMNSNAGGDGMLLQAGNDSADITMRVTTDASVTLFTVLGDGAVGVGHANPSQTLDVNGTLAVTGDVTFSGTSSYIKQLGINGTASFPLEVFGITHLTSNNTLQLFGSTTSGAQLKIEGGASTTVGFAQAVSTNFIVTNNIKFSPGFNYVHQNAGPGSVLRFNINGDISLETAMSAAASAVPTFTTHLYIDHSANLVGISHNSPSQTLDVNGTLGVVTDFNGFVVNIMNSNAGGDGMLLQAGNDSADITMRVTTDASATLFTILGDGAAGFGHANPSQTLDVSGTLAVTGNATISGTATYIKQLGVNTTNAPSQTLDVNGVINSLGRYDCFLTTNAIYINLKSQDHTILSWSGLFGVNEIAKLRGITTSVGGFALIANRNTGTSFDSSIELGGFNAVESTAITTTAKGNIQMQAYQQGGGGVTSLTVDGNMVVFSTNDQARHIFKGDGDIYTDTDQTGGLAGTFDSEEDLKLVTAAKYSIVGHVDPNLKKYYKQLNKLGIIKNGFVSHKKMMALNLGAHGQNFNVSKGLYKIVNALGKKLGLSKKEMLELAQSEISVGAALLPLSRVY